MKRLLIPLVMFAALAAYPSAQPQPGAVTVFTNVAVLPMDRAGLLRDQSVVVRNGRIEQIGAGTAIKVPQGAVTVDGRGKFLMPALAEMHAHIPAPVACPIPRSSACCSCMRPTASGRFAACSGDPRHLTYRDRVAKGEVVRPRIYTSGPSMNGKSAPTPEAAQAAVIAQKAAGYDLLKIHPGVPRAAFDALDAKADELGIPYGGHVPLDVGLHRALEAKYRSIDHVDGYVEALSPNPTKSQFFGANLINEVDESKIPALVKATRAAGTWIVPTQVLFDSLFSDEDARGDGEVARDDARAARRLVQKWIGQKKSLHSQFPAADRQKFLALRRRLLKALFDAGVPIALGSDAPQWWNVPGFSAHRELKSMVLAGLTPFQALQNRHHQRGAVLRHRDVDTVATGKRADLVLLDANPLDDIATPTHRRRDAERHLDVEGRAGQETREVTTAPPLP